MFVKERLAREGEVLHGVLSAIPSAVAAQAMAAAGADFLVVDREHSPIGREAPHAMIAATAGTGCAPLVRVPAIDEGEVKHGTSPQEYSTAVGPHMTCWIQIETLEAVQSIEAIVRVPGVDVVIVAPFDLSMALGVEGRFDAPDFVEAVAVVERAAADARLPLCGVALDGERAAELAARGYRALLRGIDVFMLQAAVAAFRGA